MGRSVFDVLGSIGVRTLTGAQRDPSSLGRTDSEWLPSPVDSPTSHGKLSSCLVSQEVPGSSCSWLLVCYLFIYQ